MAFSANGTIFKKIVNQEGLAIDDQFDIRDLYASYLLKGTADSFTFGRKGSRADDRRGSCSTTSSSNSCAISCADGKRRNKQRCDAGDHKAARDRSTGLERVG